MYLTEKMSIYPDGYEQLFFYVPTASMSISVPQIITLVNKGQITKMDIEIVSFLFEFTMASLDQLQLFEEDEEKLKRTLDKLVRLRILNKFCLVENERTFKDDAYLIYCIDKGGAELLEHYKEGEDFKNFRIEKIVQPSLKVWKLLMVVDFYIRLLESCPNKLKMFQVQPTVFLGKHKLVPHFALCVEHNNDDKYFVGDIVFANDMSPLAKRSERFAEKLIQLESLLCTNVYKKSFGMETPPTLLIIAEDDETLSRAAELVSTSSIPTATQFRLTTPEKLKKELGEKGVFYAYKNDKLTSSPNQIFVD